MSAAVKSATESDAAAFAISVALHGLLVALPLIASLYGHVASPSPAKDLPNSIAMVGNSIEVEAPTPEVAAAPAAVAAPEPEPQPPAIDVKSLPAEPAPVAKPTPALEPAPNDAAAAPAPPPKPRPKPQPKAEPKPAKKPQPSSEASTPSSGAEAPTNGAPAAGTFGQEGLAPGVRRLGYAFTRAIPAASPADTAWRELPVGHVGTIRVELAIDDTNHLGELKLWQSHPGEAQPPAVLRRMVDRTLILLRAGQFALSGSNAAGTERLTIDVTIRDDEAEPDPTDTVVQKKFDGATPGHPGRAYFRYGTGRAVEAKVTIATSGH
jgi:hypothetical protein